jgi:hypothetical protein
MTLADLWQLRAEFLIRRGGGRRDPDCYERTWRSVDDSLRHEGLLPKNVPVNEDR